MHISSNTKRRLISGVALAVVIVLGIISRTVPLGWSYYDKSLGDVLYGMAAYLGLVFLFPRVPIGINAAVAVAACLAVEFLQLTEINTELLKVPVLRWFLGRVFSWHDIVCYLLGIAFTVGVDVVCSRQSVGKAQADRPNASHTSP
jgi:Protein of unknown function (DUF2809)